MFEIIFALLLFGVVCGAIALTLSKAAPVIDTPKDTEQVTDDEDEIIGYIKDAYWHQSIRDLYKKIMHAHFSNKEYAGFYRQRVTDTLIAVSKVLPNVTGKSPFTVPLATVLPDPHATCRRILDGFWRCLRRITLTQTFARFSSGIYL